MINAVGLALKRIYNTIPKDILACAFDSTSYEESLDALIVEKVIRGRVQDDMSIRGGKIKKFILSESWVKYTPSPSPYTLGVSGSFSFYLIPPEAREHRDISCILQIRFPYSLVTGTGTGSMLFSDCTQRGNTAGQLACAVLESVTGAGLVAAPQGVIHEGNVLELTNPIFNHVPWQVTCRLRFDDNFSGMDVSSLETFCDVCEQATKAYIYNELIMKIESNMVWRGMELGVFKDIVSGYQDANEKYRELFITFGGAQALDPHRLKFILDRMVPRR